MFYDMPLYRPPSEANSLIIQATIGCSHNGCTFCNMYKDKNFKIKDIDTVKNDINYLKKCDPYAKKVFIADGDALILKMDYLRELLTYIKSTFKKCEQITMYGTPKSILLKSEDELKELKELGLTLIYMGIESGSDLVLNYVNKGVCRDDIINASQKVINSALKLSVTLIAGLGGKENTSLHALESASLISKIKPTYLAILTLIIEKGTKLHDDMIKEKFTPLNSFEVLREIRLFIENIDTDKKIIFRSNHASNYVNLAGNLPYDKENILNTIDSSLDNTHSIYNPYRRL